MRVAYAFHMTAQRKKELLNKLEHAVRDLQYPVSKGDLLNFARSWGTGDDVVDMMAAVRNETYHYPSEVMRELERYPVK